MCLWHITSPSFTSYCISNKLIYPVALIQVLPYSLTIPLFLPIFPLSAFPFMKRHLPHQVTVFLAPLSPFTEFGWKKNKWNDHDCPTILHVLQYSRSVQGSRFYCEPWTMACIPQPLSTTIATNFMFVTICISFLWTFSSSFFNPLHQAKAWTLPNIPLTTSSLSSSSQARTSSYFSFTASFCFVIFNTIKQSHLKASKFIFLHFHQTAKCSYLNLSLSYISNIFFKCRQFLPQSF